MVLSDGKAIANRSYVCGAQQGTTSDRGWMVALSTKPIHRPMVVECCIHRHREFTRSLSGAGCEMTRNSASSSEPFTA